MDADRRNEDPSPAPATERRCVSKRRLWSMRIATIGLSLLPLIAIEFALRLRSPMVLEAVDLDPLVDLRGLRPLFVLNQETGRFEIPRERWNFFRPDSFLANKPPGARRVFVLGGSTVQGRPYAIETSFATWLRLRLEAASPGTPIEVVNCGGVSYASYRVSRLLDEVLRYEPDAIVVYSGHNEFLEDREYAEVREMGFVRQTLDRVAAKIRIVTWIKANLDWARIEANRMPTEVDTRLDHVGGIDRYKRDPVWKSGVESHFRVTLNRIVEKVQHAGIPMVLCVPAGDLVATPPFKSELSGQLSSEQTRLFGDAWAIVSDPDSSAEDRLAACRRCLRLDPDHAGANYHAGRLLFEMRQPQKALPLLVSARDDDVCPLRATSQIVRAVIDVASQNDVLLVDTPTLFDRRDANGNRLPDGITDPEFFLDHVHPTIAGHQLIAEQIARHLTESGWIEANDGADARYRELAKAHLSSLDEAYYQRGRARLEGLRNWASGRAGRRDDR